MGFEVPMSTTKNRSGTLDYSTTLDSRVKKDENNKNSTEYLYRRL